MSDLAKKIELYNSGIFLTFEEALASDKTIVYFPSKEGKLLKLTKNPLGNCISEVHNIAYLDEVTKPGILFSKPKFKVNDIQKIVSVFREVAEKHSTEFFARMYWNTEIEDYEIVIPDQTVSGASVNYKVSEEYEAEKYVWVCDAHSHVNMNAFWSGTDDKDEREEGIIYFVFGKLKEDKTEFKIRMFQDGKHIDITNPFDVIEKPVVNISVENCECDLGFKISDDDLFQAILLHKVDFPEEWMDKLQTHSYSTSGNGFYSPTKYYGSGQMTLFSDNSEEFEENDFSSNFKPAGYANNLGRNFGYERKFSSIDEEDEDDVDSLSYSIEDEEYEHGVEAGELLTDSEACLKGFAETVCNKMSAKTVIKALQEEDDCIL